MSDSSHILLKGTVFEDMKPELLNANGTDYLAGYDRHNWFTIMHCEVYELEEPTEDGKTHAVASVGPYPLTSLVGEDLEKLRSII